MTIKYCRVKPVLEVTVYGFLLTLYCFARARPGIVSAMHGL